MVYGEMNRRAGANLKHGRHVLYDAATNTYAQRAQLVQLAEQHGGRAIGIWVQVAPQLAKRRAGTARNDGLVGAVVRVIPPHIFDQYVAAFEAPRSTEPTVLISGDAVFALQYRRLLRQLGRSNLPRLIQ